ncbi:tape measure protein, partial [Listeria monocytogenes]|nr:tape measure protein [Listeria monocytogenes]
MKKRMAENITGAIKALIGADTSDYKKAMAEVLSVTNSTMNQVSNTMSQSTNSIVSKVGSIMGQLSSTIQSKLTGLKTSMVAPFSTAGGQIQRVIASIGEKIPQPIRKGFSTASKAANDASSLIAKGLNRIVSASTIVGRKVGSHLTSAFNRAGTKAATTLNGIISKTKSAGSSTGSFIKQAVGIGAAFTLAQKAIGGLTSGISSLIGDLNQGSATWKTFNANMENIGMGKKEIAGVKKELQDFATKTIYSSSEMATTYSQLAAVGIKSADQLVKGFGGLAAAAENPTQAMKTLSQQATQMAAKPTVQWQDFKLMLEQTPAGIAAVAKQMGMSTSEMVTAVQDGKIKTED